MPVGAIPFDGPKTVRWCKRLTERLWRVYAEDVNGLTSRMVCPGIPCTCATTCRAIRYPLQDIHNSRLFSRHQQSTFCGVGLKVGQGSCQGANGAQHIDIRLGTAGAMTRDPAGSPFQSSRKGTGMKMKLSNSGVMVMSASLMVAVIWKVLLASNALPKRTCSYRTPRRFEDGRAPVLCDTIF